MTEGSENIVPLRRLERGALLLLDEYALSATRAARVGQTYARVLRIGRGRAWIDVDVCGAALRMVVWQSGIHRGDEPSVLLHGGRYFVEVYETLAQEKRIFGPTEA